MGESEFETADDITGVNQAQTVLDVERGATEQEIRTAFEKKSKGSDGEDYWKLVKAREVALSESVSDGSAVYEVLRKNPRGDDITSLSVAEELLQAQNISPNSIGPNNYNRIIRKSYEHVRGRLDDLKKKEASPVTDETSRAIEVCYQALRFQDLQKGKRWVTGSKTNATGSSLVTGWKYSIDQNGSREYYIDESGEITIIIKDLEETSEVGYRVSLMRNGTQISTKDHSRYGNAKRQAKRWILEQSNSE